MPKTRKGSEPKGSNAKGVSNHGPHYQLAPVLAPGLETSEDQYKMYLANYEAYVKFVRELRSARIAESKAPRVKVGDHTQEATAPKVAQASRPKGHTQDGASPEAKAEGSKKSAPAAQKRKARKAAARKLRRVARKTAELEADAKLATAQAEKLKAAKTYAQAAKKLVEESKGKKAKALKRVSKAREARKAKRSEKQEAWRKLHSKSDEAEVAKLADAIVASTEKLTGLRKKAEEWKEKAEAKARAKGPLGPLNQPAAVPSNLGGKSVAARELHKLEMAKAAAEKRAAANPLPAYPQATSGPSSDPVALSAGVAPSKKVQKKKAKKAGNAAALVPLAETTKVVEVSKSEEPKGSASEQEVSEHDWRRADRLALLRKGLPIGTVAAICCRCGAFEKDEPDVVCPGRKTS